MIMQNSASFTRFRLASNNRGDTNNITPEIEYIQLFSSCVALFINPITEHDDFILMYNNFKMNTCYSWHNTMLFFQDSLVFEYAFLLFFEALREGTSSLHSSSVATS